MYDEWIRVRVGLKILLFIVSGNLVDIFGFWYILGKCYYFIFSYLN